MSEWKGISDLGARAASAVIFALVFMAIGVYGGHIYAVVAPTDTFFEVHNSTAHTQNVMDERRLAVTFNFSSNDIYKFEAESRLVALNDTNATTANDTHHTIEWGGVTPEGERINRTVTLSLDEMDSPPPPGHYYLVHDIQFRVNGVWQHSESVTGPFQIERDAPNETVNETATETPTETPTDPPAETPTASPTAGGEHAVLPPGVLPPSTVACPV